VTLVCAVLFLLFLWGVVRVGLEPRTAVLWSLLGLLILQAALELGVRRVHRRPTTGLRFERGKLSDLSVRRSLVKLTGLYGAFLVLAIAYRIAPVYESGFYRPFFETAEALAPVFVPLSVVYVVLVDALMAKPRDEYWHAGQFFLLRWGGVDFQRVREFALGWVIKGFFLPLMFPALLNAGARLVQLAGDWNALSAVALVALVAKLALCLDLAFVVLGYVCTLRVLDSHIRSANPLVWGWVVTLICYQPIWNVLYESYFSYDDGLNWIDLGAGREWLLYLWAAAIIFCKLGWAWSNIIFGFRFSNLTHRGIITNGPYRFTKHPSYLFKNLGWWLLSVPFIAPAGTIEAIGNSIALLGVNLIYFLRAKAEERHLSEDPVYVQYALWMEDHGLFRFVRRLAPWTGYRAPGLDRA
jgi:protein-S-isoprenylcysteine O-methyltransferase Ste14